MITETDDFFCHQTVAPHSHVSVNDQSWADRAYHTLSDPDRFGIDFGVSLYPNADHVETYAIAGIPGRQLSLRAKTDLAAGRWPLRAGPQTFEVLEPMKRWRYTCEENESGISYDLEYVARNLPYEIQQPPVRKKGRLVHHDVYVFQPGFYTGSVTLDGTTFEVDRVAGQRDRTWGLRAMGEGQLPHGVLAWLDAEFDDVSVLAHIRDRGDGVPQVRDGAIYHDGGDVVPVVGFDHDLEFDHDTRQFVRGTVTLTDETGEVWEVEIAEPKLRIYLSGAGYTSTKTRRGRLTDDLWRADWDLGDADLVQRVEGLNDNISHMTCNGRTGHGVIETSIGEHVTYKVRPPVEWA